MSDYADKEKRKNDERRPFQWWLLVIGIALGIAVMLVVGYLRPQPPSAVQAAQHSEAEIVLTATAVVEQYNAGAANASDDLDPLAATATTIIHQATETAVLAQMTQAAANP